MEKQIIEIPGVTDAPPIRGFAEAGRGHLVHDTDRIASDRQSIRIERHSPQRPIAPEDQVPACRELW